MAEHPTEQHEHHQPDGGERPRGADRAGRWVFAGFLLIAAYFLWMEHRAHVVQFLPFVLLLACPLLHMLHGHGGHGGHGDEDDKRRRNP